MTSPAVIVNGVDVSGCIEYFDGRCDSGHILTPNMTCEDNPHCLYKQIQSWKTQHVELKEENKHLNDQLDQALKDFEEKAEECDKLKQQVQELKTERASLLAEKNAYEIGMQQWKDEAQRVKGQAQEAPVNVAVLTLKEVDHLARFAENKEENIALKIGVTPVANVYKVTTLSWLRQELLEGTDITRLDAQGWIDITDYGSWQNK